MATKIFCVFNSKGDISLGTISLISLSALNAVITCVCSCTIILADVSTSVLFSLLITSMVSIRFLNGAIRLSNWAWLCSSKLATMNSDRAKTIFSFISKANCNSKDGIACNKSSKVFSMSSKPTSTSVAS